jgi:hypothetical protein
MKILGMISSPLEVAGFPAAKIIYKKEIPTLQVTPGEWATTGLNIALVTSPIWVPEAIRGVKWVGGKIGGGMEEFTARLGTWPFSEEPGLERAPSPPKRTLLPVKESPFTRQGWEEFERALRGIPETKTKVDWTKALKSPPPEVSARSSPVSIRISRSLGGGTEWVKPRIQATFPEGWTITPSGRYMPAGSTPILLPDIPVVVNIAPAGLPARYAIRTIPAEQAPQVSGVLTPTKFTPAFREGVRVAQRLVPAPEKLGTISPLVQPRISISEAIKVKPRTELEAQTLQRMRELTRFRPLTKVTVSSQEFPTTTTRISPFAQPLTRLQSRTMVQTSPLTELQPQTVLQTQPLTRLQFQTTTRLQPAEATQLQTQLQQVTQTLTKLQEQLKTETRIQEKQKLQEKIQQQKKLRGKIKRKIKQSEKPKEKELPEGTVIWQQGFIKKVIPPPYSGIKPYSEYNPVPKGEGSPYETFRVIGQPTIEGEVDLGVTDIEFDGGIKFKGGGLKTNVGIRHPSTTVGMTIRRKRQPTTLRF